MQQLLLDVFTPPRPTLANFEVGQNAQLVHALGDMVRDASGASSTVNPVVYFYGPDGCGKTHLSWAIARELGVMPLHGADRFVFRPQAKALVMDDVQKLTPYSQVQLFNAFNSHLAGQEPTMIVLSGDAPASELKVRDDLKTRIGAGLGLRIQPLSDDEKTEALLRTAKSRGLSLTEEVIDYALRHFQRDMGSLMAVMDSLDRFSLEQQKPVTVHLLRHWMKRREGLLVREQ